MTKEIVIVIQGREWTQEVYQLYNVEEVLKGGNVMD